jgi:hypothetical protein
MGDHDGLNCGNERGGPARQERILRRTLRFFTGVNRFSRTALLGMSGVDLLLSVRQPPVATSVWIETAPPAAIKPAFRS